MFISSKNVNNKSFTLIELLVVIAIIGVISSVILVSMKGTRGKARITAGMQFGQTINHTLGAFAIGIWDFNEDGGATANDRSGYGNHLSLSGEWVEGIEGKGSAYKFIGAGWVTTNFVIGIGQGITYEFWFRLPDTSDTSGTFFCTEDVSDTSLEDNLGQTNYGNRGCGVSWENSDFNISDTHWHHFVFSKSSDSWLCLDAKCKSIGDATGNIPNIKKITFNGGCGCGYGNFSQGIIIDELRIYEQALSSAEIQQRYTQSAPRHGIVLK